ncbi:MAG: M14 family metallopeptidase [Candidatus Methanofastidiosia archaeon]
MRKFLVLLFLISISQISSQPYPQEYLTYEETVEKLKDIAEEHKDITQLSVIGNSYEGREIYLLKISDNPNLDEDEPEVLYMALHHAREVITISVILGFIEHFVENYGNDPYITYLVDSRELYFIPIVNPDGLIMVQSGVGDWRKNTHPPDGVDLNRNYGFKWGYDEVGSSSSPYSEVYRGEAPFSETEIQAIREFALSRSPKISLSLHSFGGIVLYPWGFERKHTKDNELFRAIAEEITKKNGYGYGSVADGAVYITNGDTDDWFYGELGVLAFTIEVYKSTWDKAESVFDNFNPPPSEIHWVIEENLYPAIYLAEIADDPRRAFFPMEVEDELVRDGSTTFNLMITNRSESLIQVKLTHDSECELELSTLKLELEPGDEVSFQVKISGGGCRTWIKATDQNGVQNSKLLVVGGESEKTNWYLLGAIIGFFFVFVIFTILVLKRKRYI